MCSRPLITSGQNWTLQFPPIPQQCPGSRLDSMSYAAASVSGTREKNFPRSASHAATNVVQNTAALWCQCMVSSFSLKSTFSISEMTFSISACRDAGSHSSSGEELCISLYWTSWGFYCYNTYVFEVPLSWRCHLLCQSFTILHFPMICWGCTSVIQVIVEVYGPQDEPLVHTIY